MSGAGLTSASTTVQTMRGGFTWPRTAIIRMWPTRREARAPRRAKRNRCSDVAQANALYLQHQHPAHILVVMQAQRAVFTRGDIEAGFRDRLQLTKTELAALVSEAMGSGAAVRLVQNSPDCQAQYVTTARASEMQRLETRT